MANFKRLICVDFDGVLHRYTSPWRGPSVIPDGPVPGAMSWLYWMLKDHSDAYSVSIYSTRNSEPLAIDAMKDWLKYYLTEEILIAEKTLSTLIGQIGFPTKKPPAWLTLDDRAWCFQGTFPSVYALDNFRPWNEHLKEKCEQISE